MSVKKYKYYFRKPRSEIVKDVLVWLVVGGSIMLGGGSFLAGNIVSRVLNVNDHFKKYSRKKLSSTFSRLRKNGLISIQTHNHQAFISLTEEGRRKAGILQIDQLRISKPKKWDGKWRFLMFDIAEPRRFSREALRGKLKELGFHLFQKSVWIHPFPCQAEVEILQEFFGFTDKEMRCIIAESMGDDVALRAAFKLS